MTELGVGVLAGILGAVIGAVLRSVIHRGRARAGAGVSLAARYPLMELGTSILFVLLALRSLEAGAPTASGILVLAAFLCLAAASVALAAIDLATSTLPNRIVLPAGVIGIALLGAASLADSDYGPFLRALVGMAALFVLYLVLAVLRPGGMGLGDVKLAGVLGLYLGWSGWAALVTGAFLAFLLGGVFAMLLLLLGRAGRASRIPFGPWMLLGAWGGVFLGERLAGWHLGLSGWA